MIFYFISIPESEKMNALIPMLYVVLVVQIIQIIEYIN